LKISESILETVHFDQGGPHIVVGSVMIRFETQGLGKIEGRLFEFFLTGQGYADIVVGLRISGI
jgi:hypothetical protein